MTRYAEDTTVPVERSRAEIDRTLVRYGAKKFGVWSEPGRALIQFELKNGREIQIPLPLPEAGKARDENGWAMSERSCEREVRRRWRVLVLTLKALLESVDSKLMTIDQAFLAYVVVPGTARTIGQQIIPKLDELYSGAWRPQFLLGTGEEKS